MLEIRKLLEERSGRDRYSVQDEANDVVDVIVREKGRMSSIMS